MNRLPVCLDNKILYNFIFWYTSLLMYVSISCQKGKKSEITKKSCVHTYLCVLNKNVYNIEKKYISNNILEKNVSVW